MAKWIWAGLVAAVCLILLTCVVIGSWIVFDSMKLRGPIIMPAVALVDSPVPKPKRARPPDPPKPVIIDPRKPTWDC